MDLTGFLFGNVNEDGELEDDEVLDKVVVCKPSLPGCMSGGCVLGDSDAAVEDGYGGGV